MGQEPLHPGWATSEARKEVFLYGKSVSKRMQVGRQPSTGCEPRASGSSCATTGSQTASSNPTTISSITAARHGTSSSINPGGSCPSDCAIGRTGSDQWDLVLVAATCLSLGSISLASKIALATHAVIERCPCRASAKQRTCVTSNLRRGDLAVSEVSLARFGIGRRIDLP